MLCFKGTAAASVLLLLLFIGVTTQTPVSGPQDAEDMKDEGDLPEDDGELPEDDGELTEDDGEEALLREILDDADALLKEYEGRAFEDEGDLSLDSATDITRREEPI